MIFIWQQWRNQDQGSSSVVQTIRGAQISDRSSGTVDEGHGDGI